MRYVPVVPSTPPYLLVGSDLVELNGLPFSAALPILSIANNAMVAGLWEKHFLKLLGNGNPSLTFSAVARINTKAEQKRAVYYTVTKAGERALISFYL